MNAAKVQWHTFEHLKWSLLDLANKLTQLMTVGFFTLAIGQVFRVETLVLVKIGAVMLR